MTLGFDSAAVERDVLAGLKGFQRRTVDYVFKRLYSDDDHVNKFLVADEVGLGKTLVARGLIARVIRHLEPDTPRIDIVYICSNAAIAEQNIRRLNVTRDRRFERPTRITLLPKQLHALSASGLNFISLTPGTSFNMGHRGGKAEERAVLFRLLEHVMHESLEERTGAYRALKGGSKEVNFRAEVRWTPRVAVEGTDGLHLGLADNFASELQRRPELIVRFRGLVERLDGDAAADDWNERQNLVQEFRLVLARACVEALEPDLVILDEFQRFRELLDEPNPEDPDDVRHLTHHLFGQRDGQTNQSVRTLLLSATPYKMHTLRDEHDDDHYVDFLRTTRFLMGEAETREFTQDLREFRRGFLDLSVLNEKLMVERKRRLERRLRRVMVRTERLSITADRSGMLDDRDMPGTRLTAGDVRAFASADRVSRRLLAGDVTDFWKSSPYLLNFMTDYKVKRELKQAASDPARAAELASCVDPATLLPTDAIAAYEAVDPGNARLRALVDEMIGSGAWQLLWMPASLPYYEGRGAWASQRAASLTKRLIFSSWNVVPDALSVLLSYEAERRMMRSRDPTARNDPDDRAKLRGLLSIRRVDGQAAGMSTFALLYPCVTLAEIADPLAIARSLGAAKRSVSADAVLEEATRLVRIALDPITRGAPTDGLEDQRWYWAAPLLLDRRRWARAATDSWLARSQTVARPSAIDGAEPSEDGTQPVDDGAWADHVKLALRTIREGLKLGRVPDGLEKATATLALGGPGNCALRSIARVVARVKNARPELAAEGTRDAALRIAWGFRTLFNVPEVMTLLRGSGEGEDVYWRRVAEEGVSGNLQAVLDEYVHVLPEWLGLLDRDATVIAERVGKAVHDAVSIRTVTNLPDAIHLGGGNIRIDPLSMRVRFALRFGRDGTDDAKVLQRSTAVLSAFNSPFWPFVLASTSIGQEGLDFHQYCHAVVHWNLPANPVDLEQREGRVHRFKGHAIRKNVAEAHRAAAFRRRRSDPWAAMFDEASKGALHRESGGIVPFWVYKGSAKVERQVPLIPLSREVDQLRRLRASIAVYRLVIGMPRQEDLIAYLGDRFSQVELEALAQRLWIDLSPP